MEEKVYNRQIYKHFLTDKILKNPQQRRLFKARDMKDLFTLNEDEGSASTETFNIFGQLAGNANVIGAQEDNQVKHNPVKIAAAKTDDDAVDKGSNSEIGSSKMKGKANADHSDGEVDEETKFLRSLFDGQGIHSAMNHDVIMNAHDEEKIRREEQASQVAQRAAEALRQSGML